MIRETGPVLPEPTYASNLLTLENGEVLLLGGCPGIPCSASDKAWMLLDDLSGWQLRTDITLPEPMHYFVVFPYKV